MLKYWLNVVILSLLLCVLLIYGFMFSVCCVLSKHVSLVYLFEPSLLNEIDCGWYINEKVQARTHTNNSIFIGITFSKFAQDTHTLQMLLVTPLSFHMISNFIKRNYWQHTHIYFMWCVSSVCVCLCLCMQSSFVRSSCLCVNAQMHFNQFLTVTFNAHDTVCDTHTDTHRQIDRDRWS